MRIRLDGPVFLTVEGPFTIEPIYVKAETRETPIPDALKPKRKAKASTPRKRRKGTRRACAYCGIGFISRSEKRIFCTDTHRHAYMRQQGYQYPLSDDAKAHIAELRIHAGASGVEVEATE